MDDLETLIEACVSRKKGNNDFALFRDADDEWQAHLGNSTSVVRLGEIDGDYVGRGRTARLAVLDLEASLPKD
jgi:hypothetical protein